MDVEKLKQKILDLAIRGQLVPQDPDDEPASVLIEKIRAEKENLIKQGKIKRDKNESYIFKGDDNSYYEKVDGETKKLTVPFSIPDNWTWVRLGSIFKIGSSKRIHKSDWRTNGIPFYRARDIEDINEGSFNSQIYIDIALYESIKQQYGIPKIGDLLVTAVGTLGKVFIVTNNKPFYYKDGNIICFSNLYNINPFFIKMLFDTDFLKKQIKGDSKGTTVDTYTIIHANDTLIPMPSICEQSRIVSRYDEILTIASKIAVSKSEINELCKQLKVSILDFYFGTDSRYKSYYTYNEEKLADIATLITKGSTPTTYGFEYLSEGINFIKVENVKDYCVQHETIKQFISEKAHEFQKRSQLEKNDLLISIAGTLGRICLIRNEDLPANTNQAFAIVRGYSQTLLPDYLKWFITWYVDSKSQQLGHGGGMNNLTLGEIKALKIKYPVSKDNQQQIIDKVNACLEIVSAIQGV